MSTAATPAAAANSASLRPLLARITRDQGPENEQTLNFAALAQVSTPTSLRTDRKIKWLDFHFRGRLTNAGTGPTLRLPVAILSPQDLVTTPVNSSIVFSLIQQITIRGQHLKYGSQTVVQMRGEAMVEYLALMLPNYVPRYSVAQNGGALTLFGALDVTAAHTNDIDFVLPVPLFPPDLSAADSVMYAIHGPDWPGNFYVDILFADGTALATANPPTVFTAFGSNSGVPTVQILSERPLLGKDYMSSIRPAITFRITFSSQPTAQVASGGGSEQKLSDLQVGKDTARIWLKTGTQGSGESAGVVAYGSLSDLIVTQTVIALDSRNLRFQGANADPVLQDYMARSYMRYVPTGYRMIDFISNTGLGPANPKSCFGSSQLTAARKYELDGDVTAASNQIAEVVQEMLLGTPGVTTASTAASTASSGS